MTVGYWFRRDLRTQDNEALSHAAVLAAQQECELAPFFVFAESLSALMPVRQHSLVESVRSLSGSIPNGLSILQGECADQIAEFATSRGITRLIATRAFDTHGMLEQARVAEALYGAGIALELIGSNYAVEPGTVRKDDGTPLKVYTPFYKRWVMNHFSAPLVLDVAAIKWAKATGGLPTVSEPAPFKIVASEAFALETLEKFRKRALGDYADGRNRTDLSGTSHLSHALAHGEIHPRTILATLGDSKGEEVFRKEIAWREFYADVMFHNPHTYDDYFEPRFANMRYEAEGNNPKLEAWYQGKTGYPMVDAAMRQLLETGWMHNRARMIVASFLVKDLHFEWQIGARFFEEHLTDHDPASNSHGWQWTAGCGTDASPYYRVFNPVLQGFKFDPNGDYVRKYIPELRHIAGPEVHEPWKLIDGLAKGYPAPIVDHHQERDEALARLEAIKN